MLSIYIFLKLASSIFLFFLLFFFCHTSWHLWVAQSRTQLMWLSSSSSMACETSLTRDRTLTPFSGRQSFSHWTPGKLLYVFKIFIYFFNRKVWKKAGSYYPLLLLFSLIQLFATPWTVACQAPLSMEFSGQEYWSGLPLPSPGDLHDPGIKPMSPVRAGGFFTTEPPGIISNITHSQEKIADVWQRWWTS